MFPTLPHSPAPLPAAVEDLLRRMAGETTPAAALAVRACVETVRAIARGDTGLPLARLAGRTSGDLRREADALSSEGDGTPDEATPADDAFRFPDASAIEEALRSCPSIVSLVEDATLTPFVLDASRLYTRRNHRCERLVRNRLDALASASVPPIPVDPKDPLLADLSDEQRDAIKIVLSHRFAILTGGPGTGKTHVLARAVLLARRTDPSLRVRLAAPTGKAAARMAESLAPLGAVLPDTPSTLHSLIAQNPVTGRCRHDKSNPLPADWLVIDEASMVDLLLFGHVLDALPPTARLLLIGDPHQLASVERGRILRDLCDASAPDGGPRYPIARLTASFRFPPAGPIARFAAAVNAGDAPAALAVLQDSASTPTLAWTPHPADAFRGPDAWSGFRAVVLSDFDALSRAATPAEALARVNDCRVLCAVRRGPYGVDRANARIREWLPAAAPMPVMVTRNDDSLGVRNGDLGIIFPSDPDTVWLESTAPSAPLRSIPRLLLPDLDPAWATTVHKSQGSEYASVAIVLPDAPDCPLLTREILYTAVTRTRSTVRLWSSEASLRACIGRPVSRASGFAS